MKLTINSRKLGKTFTFTRPGKSYIYCNGKQICRGGHFTGSTISYGADDVKLFEEICRTWYNQHIKAN